MATTLDVDPLTVPCPPVRGCGQPADQPCVSTARGLVHGTPKRRPCVARLVDAGAVMEPTTPAELAGAPRRRSDTRAATDARADAARRGRLGRPDYARIADR